MSQAQKMLAKIAKDRENFEKKKAELQQEMLNSKNNMAKIRKGDAPSVNDSEEIEPPPQGSASPSRVLRKTIGSNSGRIKIGSGVAGGGGGGSGAGGGGGGGGGVAGGGGGIDFDWTNVPVIVPVCTRVSDWCFNGDVNGLPPTIKVNDKYETIRLLGRGSFGEVLLIKNLEDSKLFANKAQFCDSENKVLEALEEVRFLRRHRHPCIIDITDCFIIAQPRVLNIVMQYCETGDLSVVISSNKAKKSFVPEKQISKWLMQIALALHFLHESGTLHRDMKPQNIMLAEGGELVKLVDFGLACEIPQGESAVSSTVEAGTPLYTPPEMIQSKPYSFPADCWALGIIIYEVATLSLPFYGRTIDDLVRSILTDPTPILPSQYSAELGNIMRALLNKDPSKRLGVAGLCLDPYLSSRVSSFPTSYRPKTLDDRTRRSQSKQLVAQIECIASSKRSSVAMVSECLPADSTVAVEVDCIPPSPLESPAIKDKKKDGTVVNDTLAQTSITVTNSPTKSPSQAAGGVEGASLSPNSNFPYAPDNPHPSQSTAPPNRLQIMTGAATAGGCDGGEPNNGQRTRTPRKAVELAAIRADAKEIENALNSDNGDQNR